MSSSKDLQPVGEKLRKAVAWFSEEVKEHPEKNRQNIIREAEIRFDLSPNDCMFLERKFC
jgi:hypothetical protein